MNTKFVFVNYSKEKVMTRSIYTAQYFMAYQIIYRYM